MDTYPDRDKQKRGALNMEYIKIPNIYKREEKGNNRLLEGQFSTPELEYFSPLKNFIWKK